MMFGYGITDYPYMGLGYGFSDHSYTFVLMRRNDSRIIESRNYNSRSAATEHMYDMLKKLGIQVVKVYDDKHDKTYICSNGYECHINREY